MEKKRRAKGSGYLFVVGGPGASGSSAISEALSNHFGLRRIYAGSLFRAAIQKKGYKEIEDFYKRSNMDELFKLDMEVDRFLLEESKKGNLLIESKIFAGILHIKDIPATVTIWLDSSLHVRTLRHLNKLELTSFWSKIVEYIKIRRNLRKRRTIDRKRYMKLYGLDYNNPKGYNDIVIDSSKMNKEETFNLILKKIKDGRYLEKQE